MLLHVLSYNTWAETGRTLQRRLFRTMQVRHYIIELGRFRLCRLHVCAQRADDFLFFLGSNLSLDFFASKFARSTLILWCFFWGCSFELFPSTFQVRAQCADDSTFFLVDFWTFFHSTFLLPSSRESRFCYLFFRFVVSTCRPVPCIRRFLQWCKFSKIQGACVDVYGSCADV